MKKIGLMVGIGIIFLAYFTFYESGDSEAYEAQVQKEIDERIQYLRTSDSSPFVKNKIAFTPPSYYDIDPSYRVNAKLERITERARLTIQNNDGTVTSYQKVAYANFKLQEKDIRLLILKPTGFGSIPGYFLGFADQTSGESTYGGGRYVDVEIGKSNKLVIDFNLAYNPYCAYGDGFTCPLPPKENLIDLPINAGEKNFDY